MADPTKTEEEKKGAANTQQQAGAPKKDEGTTNVPNSLLADIQRQIAEQERKNAELEAQIAGMAILIEEKNSSADTPAEQALRKKKNFEPKFRTIRLRKYPIAGDYNNQAYVIGWTNRGVYEEVASINGVVQKNLFIDVIFAGHDKNDEGKTRAYKVPYLDFLNSGVQEHFKIIETKREDNEIPTGEEIDVATFDESKGGLVLTGDKIDGYIVKTDVKYKISIPSVNGGEEFWVDHTYCN